MVNVNSILISSVAVLAGISSAQESYYGDGDRCPNGLNNWGHPYNPSSVEAEYIERTGEFDFAVHYKANVDRCHDCDAHTMKVWEEDTGELVFIRRKLDLDGFNFWNFGFSVPIDVNSGDKSAMAPAVYLDYAYTHHVGSLNKNECDQSQLSDIISLDIPWDASY